MKITKIATCKNCGKSKGKCGGFQKAKGHLDTQMYPECEGTPCDRDIVKRTRENREKKNKKSAAVL